jgi:DNA polymerase III delta prime subunit
MNSDFLWVEKYRPKTIDDTILPAQLKATFQQFVDQKNIPNLILAGSAGVGKTTVARAMLEELGCDYIIINGSLNGNIDTLRNDIQSFASAVSLSGGRKYVILDEADYLNANSTQPALRNFMEEFSRNCGFILTCNYSNRIIAPLHSRCSVIDFKIGKADIAKLAAQFFKRVTGILDVEKVTFDKGTVAEIINKFYPDWRRVLNELQRYSATGSIDTGILVNLEKVSIDELLDHMKNKNYTSVRAWVGKNLDNDQTGIFRTLYDSASDFITPRSIPQLVQILSQYQYQAAFAADQEINMAACLAEIMINCEFK